MEILVPISLGELYDKISILLIKKERIKDPQKLENIQKELELLQNIAENYEIDGEFHVKLYVTNSHLWDIEDKIRKCEHLKLYDAYFVSLARAIYHTNDIRSNIKQEINLKYGSNIIEEKSYEQY